MCYFGCFGFEYPYLVQYLALETNVFSAIIDMYLEMFALNRFYNKKRPLQATVKRHSYHDVDLFSLVMLKLIVAIPANT